MTTGVGRPPVEDVLVLRSLDPEVDAVLDLRLMVDAEGSLDPLGVGDFNCNVSELSWKQYG